MVDVAGMAGSFFLWGAIALIAGFVILLLGVLFIFLWRILRYKIKVDIYEKVGEGFIGYTDLAREVFSKDENGKRQTFLRLLKGLKGVKKIPLPPSSNYIPFGMRKKLNLLYKDSLFTPMPIVEHSDPAIFSSTSDLLRVLHSWDSDFSENLETHRGGASFFDKYGNYVFFGILIMTQFVLFLVLITQLKGGLSMPQVLP